MGVNLAIGLLGLLAAVLLVLYVRRVRKATVPEAPGTVLPSTLPGRWSLLLGLSLFALVFAVTAAFPDASPLTSDADTAVKVIGRLAMGGLAVGAIVTGLIALTRHGDRSVLLLLVVLGAVWVGLVPAIGSFFFE